MPDTLERKDSYAELAREAGTAVVAAGQKLKDGVSNNRTEMYILLGTIAFVIVMTLFGYALLTAG
jgi:hypothetical protein